MVKFLNTNFIVSFLDKFLSRFYSLEKNKKKLIILYDGDFQDSLGYAFLKQNISQLVQILNLLKNFEKVKLEIRTKQIIKGISEDLNQKISEDTEKEISEDLPCLDSYILSNRVNNQKME
jgi:hypothetical protein